MNLEEMMQQPYNPLQEEITEILMDKTLNALPHFFRVMTAYHFCKMASMMRVQVSAQDLGKVPINLYAINLMPSGAGKGYSTSILEDELMGGFKHKFLEESYPTIIEMSLAKMAIKRASKKQDTSEEEELEILKKEFAASGEFYYSYDSATTAAVKQFRHQLLMAEAGAINLEMDEIGSNISKNEEIFGVFLDLYDKGKTKNKLVKNTAENKRLKDVEGYTPANVVLYGEPGKVLDGGKTQELLISLLDTGYARRCLFGYNPTVDKPVHDDAEKLFDKLIQHGTSQKVTQLYAHFESLAGIANHKREIIVTRPVSIALLEYKLNCEKRAAEKAEHEFSLKAEISHRYWKALKIAGSFAFVEDSPEVTLAHLYAAIHLVEDSGEHFYRILHQERNFQRLARFITSQPTKQFTHADLVHDLTYYPSTEGGRREILALATAFAYTNNAVIRRQYVNGIELMSGEALQKTNVDELIVSASQNLSDGYVPKVTTFDKLALFTQKLNWNVCSHHFIDGIRQEENALAPFNLLFLDVDDTLKLHAFENIFKEYKYILYTTKSHDPANNVHRFRAIFPMSHILKLNTVDYKDFMEAIYEWLPFKVDSQTAQRNRKWACHPMEVRTNEGKLLDVLPFIPKTRMYEEHKEQNKELRSLTNLERWFINNTAEGNRSNNLCRYGFLLVDSGYSSDAIESMIKTLNDRIPDKLSDSEIERTILRSIDRRIAERGTTT